MLVLRSTARHSDFRFLDSAVSVTNPASASRLSRMCWRLLSTLVSVPLGFLLVDLYLFSFLYCHWRGRAMLSPPCEPCFFLTGLLPESCRVGTCSPCCLILPLSPLRFLLTLKLTCGFTLLLFSLFPSLFQSAERNASKCSLEVSKCAAAQGWEILLLTRTHASCVRGPRCAARPTPKPRLASSPPS